MNENRHTITLNSLAYNRLKEAGKFNETYSELILRLVEFYATTEKYRGVKEI